MPLSLVARLEKFPRSAVERVGPQHVIQYRGEILPLVSISRVLRQANRNRENQRARTTRRGQPPTPASITRRSSKGDMIQVVVFADKGQQVGLVVDRILDITEHTIISRSPAHRPGVLFNAVIHGRVTEFLDVSCIIPSIHPDFRESTNTRGQVSGVGAQKLTGRSQSLGVKSQE